VSGELDDWQSLFAVLILFVLPLILLILFIHNENIIRILSETPDGVGANDGNNQTRSCIPWTSCAAASVLGVACIVAGHTVKHMYTPSSAEEANVVSTNAEDRSVKAMVYTHDIAPGKKLEVRDLEQQRFEDPAVLPHFYVPLRDGLRLLEQTTARSVVKGKPVEWIDFSTSQQNDYQQPDRAVTQESAQSAAP
jgi:hypothetical protein